LALATNVNKLVDRCNQNDIQACEELKAIAIDHKEKTTNRVIAIKALQDLQALAEIAGSNESSQITFAAKSRLQDVLNSNFLRAVEEGDIASMKALAAKGAVVDPHGEARGIKDLKRVPGGFQYKLVCDAGPLASEAMLSAIRSGRTDVVQTLIDLGSKVDGEFILEQARVNAVPLPQEVVWGTCSGGEELTVTAAPVLFVDIGGNVRSTTPPTPEERTTYARYAQLLRKNEVAELLLKQLATKPSNNSAQVQPARFSGQVSKDNHAQANAALPQTSSGDKEAGSSTAMSANRPAVTPPEPDTVGIFYLDVGSQKLVALPSEKFKAVSYTETFRGVSRSGDTISGVRGGSWFYSVSGAQSAFRIVAAPGTTFVFRTPVKGINEGLYYVELFRLVVQKEKRTFLRTEKLVWYQQTGLQPLSSERTEVTMQVLGNSCYQITPKSPLRPGEYALVMGNAIYTFGVDPGSSAQVQPARVSGQVSEDDNAGNSDGSSTDATAQPSKVFVVNDPRDLKLLQFAEGAKMSNTTLPSGKVVPVPPAGMVWRVRGGKIVLEKDE
jgi:hypothetical protein